MRKRRLPRKRVVPFVAAIALAAGIGTGAAVGGSSSAIDRSCSHCAWPDYSAECLASEDGRGATKTVRRISPYNSSLDAEVTIVVARDPTQAPIIATVADNPTAGLRHLASADPHPSTQAAPVDDTSEILRDGLLPMAPVLAADRVQVVIWRRGRPTAYIVPNAFGR
jgi:hypothetical protein